MHLTSHRCRRRIESASGGHCLCGKQESDAASNKPGSQGRCITAGRPSCSLLCSCQPPAVKPPWLVACKLCSVYLCLRAIVRPLLAVQGEGCTALLGGWPAACSCCSWNPSNIALWLLPFRLLFDIRKSATVKDAGSNTACSCCNLAPVPFCE